MKTLYKLTFVILLSVSFFSCNKDSIDHSQFNIDSSQQYFKCYSNGELINIEVKSNIAGGSGRIFPADSLDSTVLNYNWTTIEQQYKSAKIPPFEIIFYKRIHHSVLDADEVTPDSIFRDIFELGNKAYILNYSSDQNNESGVFIKWTDNQGKSWISTKNVEGSTEKGTSNIINRSFQITHSIYQVPHPQLTLDLHKIRAAFNCVLYDIEGDSIIMTDAEFVGIFSNLSE